MEEVITLTTFPSFPHEVHENSDLQVLTHGLQRSVSSSSPFISNTAYRIP